MQQRQLRLGDILDDYCPRERRLTNHAVVAMVGNDVKQTRCTTCDAEHEYKHARVPRQRRKLEPAALSATAIAGAPKRVSHEPNASGTVREPAVEADVNGLEPDTVAGADGSGPRDAQAIDSAHAPADDTRVADEDGEDRLGPEEPEEGPVHRPLIRATLPRIDGQPPAARPGPDFTIRQPPGGRPNRFRRLRSGQQFQPGRSGGHHGNSNRPGSPRPGGRPQGSHGMKKRHGPGGKRSK